MSMPELRICALVPAKNESATIGDTVGALLRIPEVTQVLVIDDGSADDTADRARTAGASVLRFSVNRGQAEAIMAGAHAVTDADVFLIVDGDIGDSATAARELLLPVVGDQADMTIAVLPRGATGGFGTVRRTAQWGVRRACGIELRAPISGQRAVRAPLLRSLRPAHHFGFSISLSIDGCRSGARIMEVDVPLTHRHTGKSLAGFLHRGRQGLMLLRALWPRLTSARLRVGLILLAVLVAGAGMTVSGAANARPHGALQGRAQKVVIFGMPGLTWEELEEHTPNLEELASRGAIGAGMVKTGSSRPSTHEAYASLGAGAPLRAPSSSAVVLRADDAFESDTAGNVLARRTGRKPTGALAVVNAASLTLRNEDEHLTGEPGGLGDALAAADLRTAVVGNADPGLFEESLEHVRRPAALGVMNGGGSVDRGIVDNSLLERDPSFAFGVKADATAVVSGFDDAFAMADVVVVDPGDLDRADEVDRSSLPDAHEAARIRALRHTDSILGEIMTRVDDDTLVLVVAVRPPKREWRLTPVVASGAGVRPGYISSPGTRRSGLVPLSDIAPTVLHALGTVPAADFVGEPLRYDSGKKDPGTLSELDEDAKFRSDIYTPVSLAFIVVLALFLLLAASMLDQLRSRPRGARRLQKVALLLLAYPLATFVFRAVPGAADLGPVSLVALLIIDFVIVAIALRMRGHPFSPPVFVLVLTLVVLLLDVATGNRLHSSSLLGLSLNSAGRYYGFGNTSLALLAAATLLAGGIHLANAPRPREALVTVVAGMLLVAFVDGAPMLGNDVGGVITLAPLFTLAAVRFAGKRISWKTVLWSAGIAALALGVAASVDLMREPGTRGHLGKLVDSIRDNGWQPLTETALRKSDAIVRLAQGSVWTWLIPIAAVFLGYVLFWRSRWSALSGRSSPIGVAFVLAIAAGIWGSLVNDSGPIVLALGLAVVTPVVTWAVVERELNPNEEPELLPPTSG